MRFMKLNDVRQVAWGCIHSCQLPGGPAHNGWIAKSNGYRFSFLPTSDFWEASLWLVFRGTPILAGGIGVARVVVGAVFLFFGFEQW